MNIVVINGTATKGCTWHTKEIFLAPLRDNSEIVEFTLPRDMPHFCCGCKTCFLDSTDRCPHAQQVNPIWQAMLKADLLVFTSPVYSLGITGAFKALLDHFCVRWMVHRPEPAMFAKRAVVLTNCIGPGFMAKASQRDAANALSWMGISKIHRCGVGLLEGIVWDKLSEKRRQSITRRVQKLAQRCAAARPAGKSWKVRFKFMMCRLMHQATVKTEETPSADNRHWLEQGWIRLEAGTGKGK